MGNETRQRKPEWLRKRLSLESHREMDALLKELNINTVCHSAACPNRTECFCSKTATFMILGNNCTRNCRFCNISHGKPESADKAEPSRIAEAVKRLSLEYAVITSVTRDDLPDGGAKHFAETIKAVKEGNPKTIVEVLIPDFIDAIGYVTAAKPEVIGHNLETVKRLYPNVRQLADYEKSLSLLKKVKEIDSSIFTKSAVMLGLGEKEEEILSLMDELRSAECDFFAIGQYLQPSKGHAAVEEYIKPERFAHYGEQAYGKGFSFVAAGPYVRSSFHAEKAKEIIRRRKDGK